MVEAPASLATVQFTYPMRFPETRKRKWKSDTKLLATCRVVCADFTRLLLRWLPPTSEGPKGILLITIVILFEVITEIEFVQSVSILLLYYKQKKMVSQ